jgi:hypothetical protein
MSGAVSTVQGRSEASMYRCREGDAEGRGEGPWRKEAGGRREGRREQRGEEEGRSAAEFLDKLLFGL